ncbi:putative membrane protein [Carnobacterium maltaromaticum LMA28]|uniref:Membrane protein n=1 Tax=Carnobacterium maltaromaticum LMA28 TaxID=1234679 RepID=K8ENT5_CARML|nr:DUF308 domain-containing protein [Carnobacterium maltaromaticum]CCO10161.2 putative membrane protein [Carnobacterium maltaromaticum LMA28]
MKNIFKYLLLISAILMMAMGFWFIFNPTASLKTTTILIGLLLGGNGLVEIFSFLQERKVWNISKWILFDGFASLIAGIFILFNPGIAQSTLIIAFAIWVLFSGVMRLLTAISIKDFPGWTWLLTLGIIAILFAIFSFFTPILVGIVLGFILGFFFIIQGFNILMIYLMVGNKS